MSRECPKAGFFDVQKLRHQKIVFLKRFVMVLHGIAVLVPRTHLNSVSLHYFGIVFLLLFIVSRVSIIYGFNVHAVLLMLSCLCLSYGLF
jgi:hypothetical protein